MTITAAALTGNERAPGDFQRTAMGAPYVNHPTETTKNGKPKRVVYGRPSGFGKALDNPYNMLKWKERQLLIGVAEVAPDWATVDLEDRDRLDQLAADCYEASETTLAAERGTFAHSLTEADDRGEDPTLLWSAGLELGIPIELQRHLVERWRVFRAALGVEALAIEATVVHDGWRVAGTLDRLDKATKPIVTSLGTVAAGEALIGDIKTGSLTVDTGGTPKFWILYPTQIAAYADGVPYDCDTDTRGVWPITPHRDVALIYHYDLARALNGEPVDWQAIPVSLAAGRAGGAIAYAAKEYSWRRDLFGQPVTISDGASAPSDAVAVDAPATTAAALLALAHEIATWPADVKARLARAWPAVLATPRQVRDGLAVWGIGDGPALQAVMLEAQAPWTGLDQTPSTPRHRSPFETMLDSFKDLPPDDGGPLDPKALEALLEACTTDDKMVINAWLAESRVADCYWNPRIVGTVRSFEQARAARALASMWSDDGDGEAFVRLILATALVTDAAEHPVVPIGVAIGALTIAEAQQVVDVVDAISGERITLQYRPDGTPSLVA